MPITANWNGQTGVLPTSDVLSYERRKTLFSPVLQKYVLYTLSIKENVCLKEKTAAKRLNAVFESSDLASLIRKLPKGYDTQIGKEIDPEGINPSGGEGQKIAIARMLYHDRPIFILDEPTATLDPIAENEIYTRVHSAIKGRAAVMITHRLSAVRLADKVAVFDDGHVAEYGTHNELYAKGGIYTEMFDKQAKFYRDTSPESEEAVH